MEFNDVLPSRRSIRRYTNEPVQKDQIIAVLKAASLAPSWKNSQCARWYVITDPKKLAEIKEHALPEFNARNTANAPCLIVAGFEEGKSGMGADGEFANEIKDGWSYYDLGLATENLCLEAARLGLGTLIMGIRDEAQLRNRLAVPEHVRIVSVVSLGHPDIDPSMPMRLELDKTCVFFE